MLKGKNHFPKMIFLFKLGARPSRRTNLPLTGPGASQAVQRSFPASLVPPWCLAGCPISPFLPPWCLPGCPIGPFLPPWCLPGASQAVQLVLSCLPGASLVPPRLSNWSFPASLVPPWCLAGCLTSPFLPPWCLPGACQAVQMVLSCRRPAGVCPLASGLPSPRFVAVASALCAKAKKIFKPARRLRANPKP